MPLSVVNISVLNMKVISKSDVELIFVMIVPKMFWKENAFSQIF